MYATAITKLPLQVREAEILRHQRVHPAPLVGVRNLNAVMVDEVFRLLDPRTPAFGTDVCTHAFTSGTRKGRLVKAGRVSLAACAGDVIHGQEIVSAHVRAVVVASVGRPR